MAVLLCSLHSIQHGIMNTHFHTFKFPTNSNKNSTRWFAWRSWRKAFQLLTTSRIPAAVRSHNVPHNWPQASKQFHCHFRLFCGSYTVGKQPTEGRPTVTSRWRTPSFLNSRTATLLPTFLQLHTCYAILPHLVPTWRLHRHRVLRYNAVQSGTAATG